MRPTEKEREREGEGGPLPLSPWRDSERETETDRQSAREREREGGGNCREGTHVLQETLPVGPRNVPIFSEAGPSILGSRPEVGPGSLLPRVSPCEDRVLGGPASGEKGSKGRNELDCIRGKGVRALIFRKESCQ